MNKVYDVQVTNRFKKEYKKLRKQDNFKKEEFEKIVDMLANNEILPERYRNHLLEPKIKRNMGVSYKARCIARI